MVFSILGTKSDPFTKTFPHYITESCDSFTDEERVLQLASQSGVHFADIRDVVPERAGLGVTVEEVRT